MAQTVQTYQSNWVDKHKVTQGLRFFRLLAVLTARVLFSLAWLKVRDTLSGKPRVKVELYFC